MIKTLFFDIYQTLIDVDIEQKNIHKAWELFDNYIIKPGKAHINIPFEQLVQMQESRFYENKDRSIHHRDFKESIKEAFNKYYSLNIEDQALNNLIWEFRTRSREYFNLYPLVMDTLKKLAVKYTLATTSIAHGSYALKELEKLGIKQYFSHFILSSNSGYKKPSSQFFRIALEQTNTKPKEAIMIGDNLKEDIWGAQKLNIWTILIKNRITLKQHVNVIPDETVSIDNFDHIIDAVKRIEKYNLH